jgi:cysteinyl-tRNA synthetase
MQLFDTARGAVVPFEPATPGRVSMYVCGPTVYGPPHVGHGRMALVFDVLRRYLEWEGNEVTFVSNITDVDDNIINRANEEGRTADEVAADCEALWYAGMDAIGVKRPTADPHASAYIDEMVALTGRFVDAGIAYETTDGVYFSTAGVADYGLLARQDMASLEAGARVEVDDEKRSPVDFVLWKKAKPGEPSWESPWGPGRPGWHTECVVMSLGLLGEGFDLHGGGQDLRFPHHENERAQAVAAGSVFARHWMHNGFVEVDGAKMSKSLGNFTDLLDLVAATDPRAYRLLVLRSHYRSPVEINRETTDDASAALARLDALARRAAAADLADSTADAGEMTRFRAAMDDDLDTPAAVSQLFELTRRSNASLDAGDPEAAAPLVGAVREITGALGLVLDDAASALPAEVGDLARERDEARAAGDWDRADALRGRLQADGWVVEDTDAGTQVRRP